MIQFNDSVKNKIKYPVSLRFNFCKIPNLSILKAFLI